MLLIKTKRCLLTMIMILEGKTIRITKCGNKSDNKNALGVILLFIL